MSNELTVPFKGQQVAGAFRGINPQEESLSDGIGGGFGIIGYRGKDWSLRYRGSTYLFGTPHIDVIIVRQARNKSKSYYTNFDQNALGQRPVCASINGVVPDSDVQERQADACAVCKRNEWRTSQDGRKGKDCSDYKRLAVLLLPAASKAVLGSPLLEPVFLRVPAASLNELAQFGDSMGAQGYVYYSFITRISFVAGKAHPQFHFQALQLLSDKEGEVVLPMRDEPLTLRIIGDTPQAQIKQVSAAPPKQELLPPGSVDTGFGAAGADSKPTTVTVPATKNIEPAAETVEEADADLDARIKQLMMGS